jgi:competence CoiA-like predicted nuclease
MPLVGKNIKSGERVCILDYDKPKLELVKGEIVCPYCNQVLHIVHTDFRTKHFRHLTECNSDYKKHPESIEHLLAKQILAERLSNDWNEYSTCKIEYEFPIHTLKRIADIAFIFPNGWIVAHEIQLSKISIEDLETRTNDYLNAGLDVVWWIGKNADTSPNRKWLFENYGAITCINFDFLQENK